MRSRPRLARRAAIAGRKGRSSEGNSSYPWSRAISSIRSTSRCRSGRQPGTSTAMRPSSGFETTVAPIATRCCSSAVHGSSTPSTWVTRAGRRKMRGGFVGDGQRSTGASISSPPAVPSDDLETASHGVRPAPAIDPALEAVARLGGEAQRAASPPGAWLGPNTRLRAARPASRYSPRCSAPPITPATPIDALGIGDRDHLVGERPLDAVERHEPFAGASPAGR